LLAAWKAKPDASGAVAQLSQLMGAAQQKMSLMERRYGKVVKKVRKEADSFLMEEAKEYGDALDSYSSQIVQAETELQSAVAATKAGLKEADAASAKTMSWNDPDVMKKAQLNSQVAATERAAKKVERQRQSQVREAREHSEESLESEGQKLGMKLGDMTPIVDKAKKAIEERAEKTTAAAAKVSEASAPKKETLTNLADGLTKAVSKEKTEAADAKKKLDGFLSKADQDIASKRAKIADSVLSAQNDMIKHVLGETPAKKVAPKTKAAPAVKQHTEAKAVVKAKEATATVLKATTAAKPAKATAAPAVAKAVAKAAPAKAQK